ncbi:MAG: hypothetical protein M5R36_04230 [Deltaproteobacteria bacterium]|nr:hypothetical protein [Deltaproteobacteria bacterium]
MYGPAFAACFVLFAAAFVAPNWFWSLLRRWKSAALPRAFIGAVLAFPILFWLTLAVTTVYIRPRYYIPLYPFVFVLIAMGVSRLPWKAAAVATALLVLPALPDLANLVRPAQSDLFFRYRGVEYFTHGLTYLAAENVDAVNDELDRDNPDAEFLKRYHIEHKTEFGVPPP